MIFYYPLYFFLLIYIIFFIHYFFLKNCVRVNCISFLFSSFNSSSFTNNFFDSFYPPHFSCKWAIYSYYFSILRSVFKSIFSFYEFILCFDFFLRFINWIFFLTVLLKDLLFIDSCFLLNATLGWLNFYF